MYFSSMQLVLPDAKPVSAEVFSENLNAVCGAFDIKPRRKATEILSHLSVHQIAALDIACVGLDVAEVRRTEREIRSDPGDYYFLIMQQQGTAQIHQNAQDCRLDPGDMVIVDAAKPSHFCFDDGYSAQVSVHLPRLEMNQRFGRRISGGTAIPKEDMLGVAMRSILIKMMMDPEGTEAYVREAFFGVMGAFLTERQLGQREVNPDRIIISRALSLISEHFRDPDFTTAALADLLGVSLRRLQRAFHTINETPHLRLQMVRTEHAHRAITRSAQGRGGPSISTIAFSSGFNDLSTFYRSFKGRYGASPKEHVGRLLQ